MAKVSKQKGQNKNGANPTSKTRRTRKSVPTHSPPQRTSIYRGVTRHRWTGRYEAHLWDKNCWNQSQNKKGRQVYLGAYDEEEAAAHAYDLAALKYWGPDTILNFPWSTYQEEMKEMEGQSKEEYIGSLRRKSSGFSRGVSKYRGVARHHHDGRWEARIGRVSGNKYLYLGTYATQEEAATAYDMAAIEYRGLNAVTNFDLSRYIKRLRPTRQNNSPQNPNTHTIPSTIDQEPESSCTSGPHHSSSSSQTTPPPHCDSNNNNGSTSSALGTLLQSSKFNEMLERTTATNYPLNPVNLEPSRRSFPDDIQTFFDCKYSNSFVEGDDSIFGNPDTFASPNFCCEFYD